ncbi:hypothetical protein AYO49_03920 [Verrucomicrobiaceae bacterium SCGC AG-212-N21]|nr:hypothetical protein AYO49_03920 [Verrucomicrobiaceae bacterium SCGC AG-212-N21]
MPPQAVIDRQTRAPFFAMKHPLTALASAAVLVAVVESRCLAEEPDFKKLQTSYKAAVDRAMTPINQTYVAELKKLLEKQTKAGKLDDARATMDEIETVTGEKVEKPIVDVSDKEFEKLVVGRTWVHVMGSKYIFKKDGEGYRMQGSVKTPFIWRVHSPNLVEVTGRLADDGGFKTWYNRILSLKEAYYGHTPTQTTLKLTLER